MRIKTKRFIYSLAFIVACGLVGTLIGCTTAESQWYTGGFTIGFIASCIYGD